MRKINILILGVGGNVSQGILKAISYSKLDCKLIGACVTEDSAGLYLCDKSYISPFANSDYFIPWLISICNKENIDIIMTGVEEIILSITRNMRILEKETKAVFISSDIKMLEIGQDKLLTCEWLKNNGCNYPQFIPSGSLEEAKKFASIIEYPLIAKPRNGKGSNGIIKVMDEEQLEIVSNMDNYVIQEYIGDEDSEYTVGCYCDKNGALIDVIIMHRYLKEGTTYKATVVDNKEIYDEVIKICNNFRPKGPLNIQLRLDRRGRPICFELNVRFSGTTPMRAHFGYNDVVAQIYEYVLNKNINELFKINKGTAYRYLDEVYKMDSEKFEVEKLENKYQTL